MLVISSVWQTNKVSGKMQKELEPFRKMIGFLKIRRGMYISKDSYFQLASFIDGYLVCYSDVYNVDLFRQFDSWVQKKVKRHFALTTSAYIIQEMAKGDEKLAEKILLDLWEEYLKDLG